MADRVRIAVATCNDNLSWCADDLNALREEFKRKGLEYVDTNWDDPAVNWDEYPAIVLRTTVDYVRRAEEFRMWLGERKSNGNPRMLNSTETILWNMHKGYLKYFQENGVQTGEIVFYEKGSQAPDLKGILQTRGWQKAVVKPAISAGCYRTFAYDRACAEAMQTTFADFLIDCDIMVEKFIEEITEKGEYSLVYFDKVFSHAIHKVAAEGDFRTSTCVDGVTVELCEPPALVKEFSQKVLSLIPEDLLVARIDVVEKSEGDLVLMEVELIEPNLYISMKEGAAERFVEALQKYIM